MKSDTVVRVSHLSKKFCKSLRRAILYGCSDLFRDALHLNRRGEKLRPAEFWALSDIDFEMHRGEWLGVIGHNGAGKSTLLKLLNGLVRPDAGRIEIKGNLGALIELGAGFHPMFTGRENIYLQGAILGMSRREIDLEFDRIIDFADIGDFLDTPVKFYSSGMHARLGFSIAIHSDPDVLIVDEVLAVGDLSFQEKCMRVMERMRNEGKAVLMVTHSLYRIEALCDRAMWLDHGRCVRIGNSQDVVRAYLDDQECKIMSSVREAAMLRESANTPVTIDSVELAGEDGAVRDSFHSGERMTVRIHYTAHRRIEWPLFNVRIFHGGNSVLEASMLIDGPEVEYIEGRGTVECRLDRLPLTPKVYEVVVFARAKEGIADIVPMRTYAVFQITEENLEQWPMRGPMAINHLRQGSPVYIRRSWHFHNNNGGTIH